MKKFASHAILFAGLAWAGLSFGESLRFELPGKADPVLNSDRPGECLQLALLRAGADDYYSGVINPGDSTNGDIVPLRLYKCTYREKGQAADG